MQISKFMNEALYTPGKWKPQFNAALGLCRVQSWWMTHWTLQDRGNNCSITLLIKVESKVYEWSIEHSKEEETIVQCLTLIMQISKFMNEALNTPGKWKPQFDAALGLSGVRSLWMRHWTLQGTENSCSLPHFNNADFKVCEWGIEPSRTEETTVQCRT